MTDVAPGKLYVISAPSGAGKTSLVKALLETESDKIGVSISHTTRASRPGEENGVDYHFVDIETFEKLIKIDAFIEHAKVFDNYYGTTRASSRDQLNQGRDVILEIDWQGARQVRKAIPDCISIFILPPSRDELEKRLRDRGQDNDETIARRMRDAQSEASHYDEYNYLIINDDFDVALADLRSIFRAERLQLDTQTIRQRQLINELLA